MVAIVTLLFPVMFVVGHLPCVLAKLALSHFLAGQDSLGLWLEVVHALGVTLAVAIAIWVCRRAWPRPLPPA